MIWTFCVDQTFWSTTHIRISNVIWNTSTRTSSVSWGTNGICSTWRWVTWINYFWFCDDFWDQRTSRERISSVSSWTITNGIMIDSCTPCIVATSSYTWVTALVLDTSFIAWTFSIQYTFRSAIWWCTNETWKTSTGLISINFSALSIGATWWWHTRNVWSLWWCYHIWFSVTAIEWISTESLWAWADWIMIDNFTFSISSTSSWAWISTFLLNAGFGERTFRAQQTLWPAIWWSTKVSLQTWANWSWSFWPAFTVRSTWIWVAWVCWFWYYWSN